MKEILLNCAFVRYGSSVTDYSKSWLSVMIESSSWNGNESLQTNWPRAPGIFLAQWFFCKIVSNYLKFHHIGTPNMGLCPMARLKSLCLSCLHFPIH
jgi:hypothetical protein